MYCNCTFSTSRWGGGSLKTFIKVVKLNERLLHINEHYNVYTLNAFITNRERGFSEAVAQRIAISQRQSSAGVYESKWKVFGEWCHVKQINPVKATVQQLADFLIFLFEEKKLAISSIQGYRSCISKVFLARGIDISHDRDLNMLVRNLAIERPVQHREAPNGISW